MTQPEFQIQIQRLAEAFGKNNYGTERMRILWKEVQALSVDWFKNVVDGFIATSRQAPLPADFLESISIERERRWKETKGRDRFEIRSGYSCSYCKDTGVFLCAHPTKGGLWGFRCHCSRGEEDPRQAIPQYKQAHADDGFVWRDMPVYAGVRP